MKSNILAPRIDLRLPRFVGLGTPCNIQPGGWATIFPKDLWERVQMSERIETSDEAGLESMKLDFTICHPAGCNAEVKATPSLETRLRFEFRLRALRRR